MILRPGDIFLSAVPGFIGDGINAVQRIWDKCSHSIYSHAGIIIDPLGTTFEAQGRVVRWNLFDNYDGVRCLVARHDGMNEATFNKAFRSVKNHLGRSYPWHRIAFHVFPPLAKLNDNSLVCSELTARFLYEVEMTDYYNGATPDDLHNMICWNYGWSVVFDGVITHN